jgi:hypothetical protein
MTSTKITTATVGSALAAMALAPLAISAPATAAGGTAVTQAQRAGAGATHVVRTERQLRRAVVHANRSTGPDTIRLARNIRLTQAGVGGARVGDLDVSDDLEIRGDDHVINGLRNDRIFDVRPDTRLVVRGTTLRKGRAQDGENGGAIRNAGTTVVASSTLENNAAISGESASGGAIVNEGGTVTVRRSVLDDNRARRAGGGIEGTEGATTRIRRSELVRNSTGSTPGNGGAFHQTGAGETTVRGSMVARNRASAEGGGLWNSAAGTMVVARTSFVDNVASGAEDDQGGGGLYNDGGELTVRDSRLRGNVADGASGSGGGLLNVNGAVTVADTTFSDNDAVRAGGGIETNVGSMTITDTRALRNSTGANPGNGGGLHITGAGNVTWDGGDVLANTAAAEGGGLWNSATGTLIVTDVTIQGNEAPVNPDNHNDGGVFTVDGQPVPPTP